jgi:hypothetical protein
VAFNGESWFLGQAFRLAQTAGLRGVVSFSDPVARTAADGTVVKPGPNGVIYQATNAAYLGLSTRTTHVLLRDGTVFDNRTAQIRRQDCGHEYAERRLIAMGARPVRAGQSPAAWLAQALEDAGARRQRHPGKHRYAFRLGSSRRDRAAVVIALRPAPYPKRHLGQAALFDMPGRPA